MSFNYSYGLGDALGWNFFSTVQMMPTMMAIAGYILSSLGFYTLARRRGIRHAWLSWVPVANIWILGSLSDQYRYVVRGQIRSRRKLLLTLKILTSVLGTVVLSMVLGTVGQMLFGIVRGIDEKQVMELFLGTLLRAGGLGLLLLPLAIVTAVFRYMALYDLYRSCAPDDAVLFLVVGILFSFTEPFFIFFSREKELGMPPRRPASGPAAQEAPRQPDTAQQPETADSEHPEYL